MTFLLIMKMNFYITWMCEIYFYSGFYYYKTIIYDSVSCFCVIDLTLKLE